MNHVYRKILGCGVMMAFCLFAWHPALAGLDISPPGSPVKLVFIHHSCGEYWLSDTGSNDNAGGLGTALMTQNYFVSDTNYDWGPSVGGGGPVGDRTDIPNWWDWFRGPDSAAYLGALYAESGRTRESYSRLATDPGGENQIVLFKSCFPNSFLSGNPNDAAAGQKPFEGNDSSSMERSVANSKWIYNDLLNYFQTRQDKLFILITAPPYTLEELMGQGLSAEDARRGMANGRALADWLVNDWLDAYPYANVAVFDFYNVLTSNGGDRNTNDAGFESGNHHRIRNGAMEHVSPVSSDFSAYSAAADGSDSHPSSAGNQKATQEFIPLLNHYYQRWKSSSGTSFGPDITGLSFDVTGAVPVGGSVTMTAQTGLSGGETIYYRFDLIPNYGTTAYDPWNGYQILQDFSPNPTLTHMFSEAGSYVVIVYASTTPGFPSGAWPIMGGSITVGDPGLAHIQSLVRDGAATVSVGESITFTGQGVSDTATDTFYYRFDLIPNYGTTAYDPWNGYDILQDFSVNAACTHTFTQAGNYILIMYVSNIAGFQPGAAPIIGGAIRVIP